MEGLACESEAWVSSNGSMGKNPDEESLTTPQLWRTMSCGSGFCEKKKSGERKTNKKNQVLLEGYVESADEDDLTRTKSLTDEDLDELKGCLDLGFGFSYDEIPELCNTLPALELCYSMSQKYMDEHQKSPDNSMAVSSSASDSCSSVSSPIANWKISSPGDHPEDVKARLKYWAQAVACTDALIAIRGGRIPSPGSMPSFEEIKEILGFNVYYEEEKWYATRRPSPSQLSSWRVSSSVNDTQQRAQDNAEQRDRSLEDPVIEVITPDVYNNVGADVSWDPFSRIWSRTLRIKLTGRDGFEKLDVRIPAGFLEGVTNIVPALGGVNLKELLDDAAYEPGGKLLLDFNDTIGDRIQVFLE